jgi:hypothetical protein
MRSPSKDGESRSEQGSSRQTMRRHACWSGSGPGRWLRLSRGSDPFASGSCPPVERPGCGRDLDVPADSPEPLFEVGRMMRDLHDPVGRPVVEPSPYGRGRRAAARASISGEASTAVAARRRSPSALQDHRRPPSSRCSTSQLSASQRCRCRSGWRSGTNHAKRGDCWRSGGYLIRERALRLREGEHRRALAPHPRRQIGDHFLQWRRVPWDSHQVFSLTDNLWDRGKK